MDLEAALSNAEEREQKLLHEREQIDESLVLVAEEKRGLLLAIERHRGEPLVRSANLPPIARMFRTDAVEYILELDRPKSPTEIVKELHASGRTDSYNKVSATLSQLEHQGRAHARSRGQWARGPRPVALEKVPRRQLEMDSEGVLVSLLDDSEPRSGAEEEITDDASI